MFAAGTIARHVKLLSHTAPTRLNTAGKGWLCQALGFGSKTLDLSDHRHGMLAAELHCVAPGERGRDMLGTRGRAAVRVAGALAVVTTSAGVASAAEASASVDANAVQPRVDFAKLEARGFYVAPNPDQLAVQQRLGSAT